MKAKWMLASLLALLIVSMRPTPAYACDAWLCLGDVFGWTDVAKVHSDRDVKQAEIERQKTEGIARVNADAQARIAEANRQIQADITNGKITMAQAQAQADAFKALVEQKASESIAGINRNADTAIAGINNAGQINLAGVQETGETARASIAAESHNSVVLMLIVGGLLAIVLVFVGFLMLRKTGPTVAQAPQITVVMQPNALPGSDYLQLPGQRQALRQNEYRMIEVDHE